MKPRIAIVGGGITGAFAAYFIARLGALPTIIERDRIGGQASGHNAGGLNPLHGAGIPGPLAELALESLRLHLDGWDEIRRLTNADFGGRRVPRILVAMDQAESAALDEREELHNATPGFSARWLSASELRRVAPQLASQVVGGLWTEGNVRVDPGPYTRAVARAAVRLGASTVRAQARELTARDGRATGVVLDSGTVECDGVVIASGPWGAEPARWLGFPLPVSPLKGELLLVEPVAGALPAEITWRQFGAYQAGHRRLWLGGTEERVGFDAAPSRSARERILSGIQALMPRLGPVRLVQHVAGLRPDTPDSLPILGIPGGWENVCLATGAGRKGMLLSAGLGRAAAELLVEGGTPLPIGDCHPDRLGGPR